MANINNIKTFKELLKEVNSENYEILEKYNCFEELYNITDINSFIAIDIMDLLDTLLQYKIVKIIKNDNEIVINNSEVNSIIYISYNCQNMRTMEEKIDNINNMYGIDDFELLFGAQMEDQPDFSLYLSSDDINQDFDKIEAIINKYGLNE